MKNRKKTVEELVAFIEGEHKKCLDKMSSLWMVIGGITFLHGYCEENPDDLDARETLKEALMMFGALALDVRISPHLFITLGKEIGIDLKVAPPDYC